MGQFQRHSQKAMTQEKPPSPGLALVKIDFSIGTKWGSRAGRKQNRPSPEPKGAAKADLSPRQSILCL